MIRALRSANTTRLRVALTAALVVAAGLLVPPAAPTSAATGDLLISGIVDGPLTGGTPKAIEFYAVNDIADLSIYGFGSANNGGGSDGEEFTFPAVAATAGQYIYVASEAAGFTSFFGFAPDYTSGAASINGDDAIELFQNSVVVDVFGDIGVDGTGEPWDHVDGWAYRVDDTGQDGSTFELANWTFSGPDALDGETTNDTAATPFPIGSYTATGVTPVDLLISGVVDGPLSGGIPKAIEFYAVNDIADLSIYGFGSANNGGGSDGEEFTFPAVAATAGQYIYVASEAAGFTSFFGFAPDYTSGAASINGDDAIELFQNSVVVDVFGDIGVDGTGEPWDHLDGWAYRVDATGPDGSTFELANWTFSGPDALDGETTNDTAATPMPIGTYSSTVTPPVNLIISGVVDGPLSGGVPKAVEFYVLDDIADLSIYGFGSANNGGGSDGQEFTFPAVAATAGTHLHVASESTGFTSFFGFAPDYTSGAANINGDDAIELFQNSAVVDVFGDIDVDGSGQAWEYTDGWAYRVDGTGPDGSTFALGNWTFSGPNALDGETTNDTAATPMPIGTYSSTVTPPVDLIITGVVDGPLSGGTPKAVEFYAVNDIADLSVYGFGSANNGDGSDGEEFTFPAVAATAGDYIHVASESTQFDNFFGFPPDYTSGAANINGDDAIELFQGGAVVDVLGHIDVDGSGQAWEYTDGWAYRVDGTGPDGSTFALGNWTFSGPNALDGETTNDTAAIPMPIGTYSTSPFVPLSFIHQVQGSGPSVAISGTVKVDAIVTSLVRNNGVVSGFFLQEEDADIDGNPLTSEGILVTCDALCPVGLAVEDNVTVTGDAGELFGMSEIDASVGGIVTINSSDNALPTSSPLGLPAPAGTDEELTFEPVEGMLVTFTDELFVSEYFELARFGQVVLTVDERPYQFTHDNLPSVDGYAAFLDDLATRRIVLDDDNNNQNSAINPPGTADDPYYYPIPGFSTTNTFRGGDSIAGLTGPLDWAFGEWRVNPTPEAFDYTFTSNNPRPAEPDPVGGTLTVASFNVLNFFTTIDTGANICGPNMSLGCRGAHSTAELDRQREKIVSALAEIDADIVGLIEIENNADASLIDLVDGLNAAVGAGTYSYVDTGTIGGDAIKVAFIYKPATVDLVGDFAILDSTVDPTFIDTKNRPVLIQTFEETATGAAVTIAVNHLKSKGSSCDDVGDPGLGDGQANCNLTRTSAATALVDYLATDPTGSGDPDVLIIGDLNAYAKEDPIEAITRAGYTDLIDSFGGPDSYSFVFDGQLGYLDHALANGSLLQSVTGVTEWHINADEVNVLDYNDGIEDPGEQDFERKSNALPIYEPNGFRSSDHDPLVIGLDMATARSLKERARDDLADLLPTGDRQADRSINRAIRRIEQSLNPAWWVGDSTLDAKQGKKVFTREFQAAKALEFVKAVDAQPAVDKLIEADRMLVTTQLQIAIDAGADPAAIDKVQHLLDTAERYVRYGWYPKSILAFRDAWKAAVKATP